MRSAHRSVQPTSACSNSLSARPTQNQEESRTPADKAASAGQQGLHARLFQDLDPIEIPSPSAPPVRQQHSRLPKVKPRGCAPYFQAPAPKPSRLGRNAQRTFSKSTAAAAGAPTALLPLQLLSSASSTSTKASSAHPKPAGARLSKTRSPAGVFPEPAHTAAAQKCSLHARKQQHAPKTSSDIDQVKPRYSHPWHESHCPDQRTTKAELTAPGPCHRQAQHCRTSPLVKHSPSSASDDQPQSGTPQISQAARKLTKQQQKPPDRPALNEILNDTQCVSIPPHASRRVDAATVGIAEPSPGQQQNGKTGKACGHRLWNKHELKPLPDLPLSTSADEHDALGCHGQIANTQHSFQTPFLTVQHPRQPSCTLTTEQAASSTDLKGSELAHKGILSSSVSEPVSASAARQARLYASVPDVQRLTLADPHSSNQVTCEAAALAQAAAAAGFRTEPHNILAAIPHASPAAGTATGEDCTFEDTLGVAEGSSLSSPEGISSGGSVRSGELVTPSCLGQRTLVTPPAPMACSTLGSSRDVLGSPMNTGLMKKTDRRRRSSSATLHAALRRQLDSLDPQSPMCISPFPEASGSSLIQDSEGASLSEDSEDSPRDSPGDSLGGQVSAGQGWPGITQDGPSAQYQMHMLMAGAESPAAPGTSPGIGDRVPNAPIAGKNSGLGMAQCMDDEAMEDMEATVAAGSGTPSPPQAEAGHWQAAASAGRCSPRPGTAHKLKGHSSQDMLAFTAVSCQQDIEQQHRQQRQQEVPAIAMAALGHRQRSSKIPWNEQQQQQHLLPRNASGNLEPQPRPYVGELTPVLGQASHRHGTGKANHPETARQAQQQHVLTEAAGVLKTQSEGQAAATGHQHALHACQPGEADPHAPGFSSDLQQRQQAPAKTSGVLETQAGGSSDAYAQAACHAYLALLHGCDNHQLQQAASASPAHVAAREASPSAVGKLHGTKLSKKDQYGQAARRHSCGPPLPHRLQEAEHICHTFAWQQDALDFAERCNAHLASLAAQDSDTTSAEHQDAAAGPSVMRHLAGPVYVFCQEKLGAGKYFRQFLAASQQALWQRYRRCAPQERHWYEVIWGDRPCHLYFDLEFITACNPKANGNALVEHLLHSVAQHIRQIWGYELQQDWVLELDSSTPTKFSRHVVIQIPGCAFASCQMVGNFVTSLLASPEAQALMLVKEIATDSAGRTSFASLVDTAVYTKNRHFRMLGCSKGGKTAMLLPHARYATRPGHGLSYAAIYKGSLICHVPQPTQLLQIGRPQSVERQALSSDRVISEHQHTATAHQHHGDHSIKLVDKQDESDAPAAAQHQARCFEDLAGAAVEFLEAVAQQRAGGLEARVRTQARCGGTDTYAFSMIGPGSHWCENIGRCHQSNHIYFVVRFGEGVWAQKCHDPSCADFRSSWMPVPLGLQP
ncbi:hypothetical protein WJX74_002799 [Apatococcus lobatus]|uniref:DNA-directed primase/polymerase protein n=1 Tax=Apatococcus lobatus TaxID=904363 RepID=A0AAW1QY69_9CHLO